MPDSCSFGTVNHHQSKAAVSWGNVKGMSGLSDCGSQYSWELPAALGCSKLCGCSETASLMQEKELSCCLFVHSCFLSTKNERSGCDVSLYLPDTEQMRWGNPERFMLWLYGQDVWESQQGSWKIPGNKDCYGVLLTIQEVTALTENNHKAKAISWGTGGWEGVVHKPFSFLVPLGTFCLKMEII